MSIQPTTNIQSTIEQHINTALHKWLEEARDRAIQQAVKEFEADARKITAQTVLMLLNQYSVEQIGQELVIRVKIEAPESK